MLEAAIPRIPSACLPTAHRSASLSPSQERLRAQPGGEEKLARCHFFNSFFYKRLLESLQAPSAPLHPLHPPHPPHPLHLCTSARCTSAPLHPSIPANLSTRLAPRHRRRSQCAAKTPSPSAKPSSASSGGPSTSTSSIRHACNHSTRACKHSTQNCNRSAHACNHSNTSPPARDRSNTHQQPRPRRTSSSCRSPRACTGPSR